MPRQVELPDGARVFDEETGEEIELEDLAPAPEADPAPTPEEDAMSTDFPSFPSFPSFPGTS